jgi:hypothetical protein
MTITFFFAIVAPLENSGIGEYEKDDSSSHAIDGLSISRFLNPRIPPFGIFTQDAILISAARTDTPSYLRNGDDDEPPERDEHRFVLPQPVLREDDDERQGPPGTE